MFGQTIRLEEDEDRKDVFGPVADLMVGVVFIFIVLLIALSLSIVEDAGVPTNVYESVVKERDGLRDELAKLKSKLLSEQQRTAQLEKDLVAQQQRAERLAEFVRFVKDSKVVPLMDRLSKADETRKSLLEDIRNRLRQAGVEVTIDATNGTLRLPAGRLFESGQAVPADARARETIQTVGRVLSETLPCYGASVSKPAWCPTLPEYTALAAVYVEGHTDAVPILRQVNQFRDNWELSTARAIEAFKILRDASETLRDIRNLEGDALLGVSGYAETRPSDRQAQNRLAESIKEQDRRIEVRLTMSTDRQAVGQVLQELNSRLETISALVR